MTTREALRNAAEALEEIALAGMSGSGQESEEGMRDWHARRAWEFIRIAARALDPARAALAQQAPAVAAEPVLHALRRVDGKDFVRYDGVPMVSTSAIVPFAPGQQSVPLYAAPQPAEPAQPATQAGADCPLVGPLAMLPDHVKDCVRAYGDARVRLAAPTTQQPQPQPPQAAEPSRDAERLDWIINQGDEYSQSVIKDAPGDGEYQVWGMGHVFGRGKTPRDAIDAARAAQAQGEKGAG